jgi:alpha-L-fucosidase
MFSAMPVLALWGPMLLAVRLVAAAPSYEANADSLARHPLPEWFEDAKFGMFIDWGIYSVPGWGVPREKGPTYPDWYLYRMYQDPALDWRSTRDYHAKTWGKDFQRDDFIPLFTAKAYDPEGLAALAKRSGMKYVVPFAKHHDGFCLWPSSVTQRDAMDMGPKRDLIAPLVKAAREQGLKFGFYQSLGEWEYPLIGANGETVLRIWDTTKRETRIEPWDEAKVRGRITGKLPVRDYARDYLVPQSIEFIDRYDPDLIWFDGDWIDPVPTFDTYRIISHFYNQAAGRKEVAVNDRWGKTRGKAGDFHVSEYGAVDMDTDHAFKLQKALSKKWEECRGISQSFGFNHTDTDANVMSATALVHMLATIVSRNGNLLLVVNLDGEGALPDIQRTRLEAIGDWLQVNGEAIYETRPWTITQHDRRVVFTKAKDGSQLYVICFDWPEHDLVLPGVPALPGGKVRLLGSTASVGWQQEGANVRLTIPAGGLGARPCDHAFVFAVPLLPQ